MTGTITESRKLTISNRLSILTMLVANKGWLNQQAINITVITLDAKDRYFNLGSPPLCHRLYQLPTIMLIP